MRVRVQGAEVFIGTGSRPFADDRPVLLLIHGAGMDHSVWVRVARHFARQGWSVAAPDLPGHGRSAGPPLDRVEAMASWLAALLDSLSVSEAVVAGHSLGSLIALAFAAASPERCRGLALLGASLPMPVSEGLLSAARAHDHAAIDMANTWSHSVSARIGGSPDPGFWLMACGERLLEATDPAVFRADLEACDAYRPVDGSVGELSIRCPVLVLAGEADQMTPARAGRAVAEAIDGARLVSLPGCGHAMLAERPDPVLDAMRDFILAL